MDMSVKSWKDVKVYVNLGKGWAPYTIRPLTVVAHPRFEWAERRWVWLSLAAVSIASCVYGPGTVASKPGLPVQLLSSQVRARHAAGTCWHYAEKLAYGLSLGAHRVKAAWHEAGLRMLWFAVPDPRVVDADVRNSWLGMLRALAKGRLLVAAGPGLRQNLAAIMVVMGLAQVEKPKRDPRGWRLRPTPQVFLARTATILAGFTAVVDAQFGEDYLYGRTVGEAILGRELLTPGLREIVDGLTAGKAR